MAAAGAKSAGRCTHALNMQAGDWSRCDFAEFTMSGTDISKSNADFARFSFAVLVGLLGSETSFRGVCGIPPPGASSAHPPAPPPPHWAASPTPRLPPTSTPARAAVPAPAAPLRPAGAYFEGAIARRAVFNNADLTDASLIGADLQAGPPLEP